MENSFRVASTSHSTAVAGAIAGSIREDKSVVLQAIGAGSVNQAVKAIAIARGYLAGEGLDVVCVPEFVELDIDGHERTAVRFHLDQPGRPIPPAKAWAPKSAPIDGRSEA
jgi:stage V sporulation protein S